MDISQSGGRSSQGQSAAPTNYATTTIAAGSAGRCLAPPSSAIRRAATFEQPTACHTPFKCVIGAKMPGACCRFGSRRCSAHSPPPVDALQPLVLERQNRAFFRSRWQWSTSRRSGGHVAHRHPVVNDPALSGRLSLEDFISKRAHLLGGCLCHSHLDFAVPRDAPRRHERERCKDNF
jgi:hypothetical protein